MMNDLIKVNYDTEQPTVSARELYKTLEISKRFSAWFETNSQGFIENQDFTGVYLKVQGNQYGGEQEVQDYSLTVDMAKHICLMSRTDKGKQCRQYLIDLEKAWNTPEQIMARALQFASKQIESLKGECKFLGEQVVEQQKLISELEPKANYVDMILQSKSLVLMTQIAKDYGMSARKMNQILNDLKVQYKAGGQWVLYSKYQNQGYVHSRTIDIVRSNRMSDVKMQTEWTQKGRLFLYELLKKEGYMPLIEAA